MTDAGSAIEADHVMLATGRKANVKARPPRRASGQHTCDMRYTAAPSSSSWLCASPLSLLAPRLSQSSPLAEVLSTLPSSSLSSARCD